MPLQAPISLRLSSNGPDGMAGTLNILICDQGRNGRLGGVASGTAGVRGVVIPEGSANANAYTDRSCGRSKKNASGLTPIGERNFQRGGGVRRPYYEERNH
jgi:hypothetical protein